MKMNKGAVKMASGKVTGMKNKRRSVMAKKRETEARRVSRKASQQGWEEPTKNANKRSNQREFKSGPNWDDI